MSRLFTLMVFAGALLTAQTTRPAPSGEPQEPPEESEALKEKEYSFNPLQASKELKVGDYYYKKGSHRAAAMRYLEATKWNPGWAEAWLKLGESREKLKDTSGAREAYAKYIELEPDSKRAQELKRRLQREREK